MRHSKKNRAATPPPSPASTTFDRLDPWVAAGIAVLTVVAFAAVGRSEFLKWDDFLYVVDNPHVTRGLTWEGVRWALTAGYANNWHPLTWLSHMLDVRLFGLASGAHHAVNLGFHVVNALLLFGLLRRMGGPLGRSAFVAALFAVHPMHVESVAWLSERKDVLSGLFFMLTLWGYVEYVRRPSSGRYLAVLVLFALGLVAKPMLVTLPFVLLLLDSWPLGRMWKKGTGADLALPKAVGTAIPRLIVEKLPLFALAAVSSYVTFAVQQQSGAVASETAIPLWVRLTNPLISYVAYIGKMLWPTDLAALYPYPKSIAAWQVIGSLLLLGFISYFAIRSVRNRPYFAVGWLWFLGTLVPVIGWVQVGRQAMADRYTYLPYVGLFIMVAWGIAEWWGHGRKNSTALVVAGGLAIAACTFATWTQVPYWRDGVSLWTRTIAVTRENSFAHFNLGVSLAHLGNADRARAEYVKSLAIDPEFPLAHNNLGAALVDLGRTDEAIVHFTTALRIAPQYPEAHTNLGSVLAERGQFDEAAKHFEQALSQRPDDALPHIEMGIALARQGRVDDAILHYTTALRINPNHAAAHNNLGTALERRGRIEDAIPHYATAVRLNPNFAVAYFNLGAALSKQGRDRAAIPQYLEALRIQPDHPSAHNNLGAALANEGRLEEAIPHFAEALRLRPDYADARRNLDSAQVMLRVR